MVATHRMTQANLHVDYVMWAIQPVEHVHTNPVHCQSLRTFASHQDTDTFPRHPKCTVQRGSSSPLTSKHWNGAHRVRLERHDQDSSHHHHDHAQHDCAD